MANSDSGSWFSDGTSAFYPSPDPATNGNLYVSNTPNSATGYVGGNWATTTTGTWSTWSNVTEKVNKKVVVKCSKCGAKIAEYWAKVPMYGTDEEIKGSDVLCETCHKIEKLKE